jgi:integrase
MSDIKTGFTGAVRTACIDDLTFYDLRHTWSTKAAELGVPEPLRRDILGHSSRTMTDSYTHSTFERRYSHATPEAIREAVQRLEQRAGEVLEYKRRAG